jgi:MYXO-CTERM domain-containing protein
MSEHSRIVSIVVLLAASAATSQVHAHFNLLKPASWLKEDSLGGPQKGRPCGPGSLDDVQPTPLSDAVTTVHAGDTIQVELQETINHPGYFRVSLAADRASFTDPPLTDATACSLDLDSVPTGAHDNVLMDGIAKSASLAPNRHIMQDVKLPDEPCDNCTLQVLQVMKDHGPPNCFYYHCAVLKILPAEGSAAGSGGAGSHAAAGSSGAGGTPSSKSSGCSVALGARASGRVPLALLVLGVGAALQRRRRQGRNA